MGQEACLQKCLDQPGYPSLGTSLTISTGTPSSFRTNIWTTTSPGCLCQDFSTNLQYLLDLMKYWQKFCMVCKYLVMTSKGIHIFINVFCVALSRKRQNIGITLFICQSICWYVTKTECWQWLKFLNISPSNFQLYCYDKDMMTPNSLG